MADPLPTPWTLSLFVSLQLEQKQKEALELLEQNRHLQDQLKVALGREQSAREGYVLQVGELGGEGKLCAQRGPCRASGRAVVGTSWLMQRWRGSKRSDPLGKVASCHLERISCLPKAPIWDAAARR